MYSLIDTAEMFKKARVALNETNDCVVRAIAIAFTMEYKQAHAYCEHILKRKHRKGTFTLREFDGEDFLSSITKPMAFNKQHFSLCKHPNKANFIEFQGTNRTGLYLKKFLKTFNKGTYLVISSGHAYCVKDGVVYGNSNDDRTYVKLAYRIEGDVEVAKQNAGWLYKSLIFKK